MFEARRVDIISEKLEDICRNAEENVSVWILNMYTKAQNLKEKSLLELEKLMSIWKINDNYKIENIMNYEQVTNLTVNQKNAMFKLKMKKIVVLKLNLQNYQISIEGTEI